MNIFARSKPAGRSVFKCSIRFRAIKIRSDAFALPRFHAIGRLEHFKDDLEAMRTSLRQDSNASSFPQLHTYLSHKVARPKDVDHHVAGFLNLEDRHGATFAECIEPGLRVLQSLDARGLYRNSIIMTYTNHTFKDRPTRSGTPLCVC